MQKFLVAALAAVVSGAGVPAAGPGPATLKVTRAARTIQPGELVVLTIDTMRADATVGVQAFGRSLPTYRHTDTAWRVIVGLDLDVKPGRHVVSIVSTAAAAAGPVSERLSYPLVVTAKSFPTRKLTVDPAFVNPPPEVRPRIDADAERLRAIWVNPSQARLWDGAFAAPVPDKSNSAFGSRSVFNGQVRNPHSGADFPSKAGTPVAAPNAGHIALAADLYFTGNTVIVDHGLGLFSLFAHLSAIDVKAGDSVRTGQVLGLVGATGRVTAPHLHWAVRVNDARVDPLSLLAVLGSDRSRN